MSANTGGSVSGSATSAAIGSPTPVYFSGDLVIALTSCPASIKAGQSRDPMNPDAPVTRTRSAMMWPFGSR